MKVKIPDLQGAALDYAVAICQGEPVRFDKENKLMRFIDSQFSSGGFYWPSESWEQGGPIIEHEGFKLYKSGAGDWCCSNYSKGDNVKIWADRPLIAAMRCYVASKLAETVEIPDELLYKPEDINHENTIHLHKSKNPTPRISRTIPALGF